MITNRIFIKAYPYKPKSIEGAVAGDLLCYYNGSLLIYPQTQYGGTPIGVVVIPTSHNLYGNGSCGVMSLVQMNCGTPDTGTIENWVEMPWGGYGYGPYEELNDITLVNGAINTEILCSKSNLQPNWRTDENISSNGYAQSESVMTFPAACCCWRYHTLGTKQGDWYLPSVIELKRINTVLTELQNTIEAIPDKFVLPHTFHWSCIGGSEKNTAYLVHLGVENGVDQPYASNAPISVKAFMQAGPDIVSE